MSIPKSVTLTREGGHYWRAVIFRAVMAYSTVPFVALFLLLALLNPFWFRDSFFSFIERQTNKFSRWISYRQYAIYLGTDPEVWHALKGDSK